MFRVKVHPITGHEGPEGEQMHSSTLPSASALYGDGWSTPRPSRFTPEKDPVPIVQGAGWAPGPVWTGAENLTPTVIRSPNRPARSESLYRLSYRGLLKRYGGLHFYLCCRLVGFYDCCWKCCSKFRKGNNLKRRLRGERWRGNKLRELGL